MEVKNESKQALLTEILAGKTGVDLEFVGFETDETSQGDPIIILTLAEPKTFMGRRLRDNTTGDSVRLRADDVEYVTINPKAIEVIKELEAAGETVFTWKEPGVSGRIKTDKLTADVSGNEEVWITDEKFAKFGARQRNEARSRRNSGLINKLRNKATKEEFANTKVDGNTKPEPVAGS